MANDDFKWFGEGFDGFPKFLPEDCVEYTLYIIDSKLNDFDVREKLREVQSEANKLIKKLLKEFIWQREKFALELVRKDGQTRSFLQGRTNYGDSVEDEWLIVYILQVLSRNFAQLWIRIVDTDGQFLLIEAANAIPRWLNPENAEFRVSYHPHQTLFDNGSSITDLDQQWEAYDHSCYVHIGREFDKSAGRNIPGNDT